MKNISIHLFVFFALLSQNVSFAQDSIPNELQFEVNVAYPYISITEKELTEANSLEQLNHHFKPSWIKKYISVEIQTTSKGNTLKATNTSNTLSPEQKSILEKSDVDSEIAVNIQYIPENTLKNNEPKELSFSIRIDPNVQAKYPDGLQQLKKYLFDSAINKIPSDVFHNFDLMAIEFTINEQGKVMDAHVFNSVYQTFGHQETEALLLKTIQDMPLWQPAQYANGTKTKQHFVLSVGNMENCMTSLLNIKKY